MLQYPLQHIRIRYEQIQSNQSSTTFTPRRTIILEPPTTTSAAFSGTSIDLSSLVRFLDAPVVEPMILLVDHAADECGASIKNITYSTDDANLSTCAKLSKMSKKPG